MQAHVERPSVTLTADVLKRVFAEANYRTKNRARVRDNEISQSRVMRRKKLYRSRCSGGAATPTRRSGHAFVGNEIICHRSEFFSRLHQYIIVGYHSLTTNCVVRTRPI